MLELESKKKWEVLLLLFSCLVGILASLAEYILDTEISYIPDFAENLWVMGVLAAIITLCVIALTSLKLFQQILMLIVAGILVFSGIAALGVIPAYQPLGFAVFLVVVFVLMGVGIDVLKGHDGQSLFFGNFVIVLIFGVFVYVSTTSIAAAFAVPGILLTAWWLLKFRWRLKNKKPEASSLEE